MRFLSKKISLASLLLFLSSTFALWGQNLYYLDSDGNIYTEQTLGDFDVSKVLSTKRYGGIQFSHGDQSYLYGVDAAGEVSEIELSTGDILRATAFSENSTFFVASDNNTLFNVYNNSYYLATLDENSTALRKRYIGSDLSFYNSLMTATDDFLFLYSESQYLEVYAIADMFAHIVQPAEALLIKGELKAVTIDPVESKFYWIERNGDVDSLFSLSFDSNTGAFDYDKDANDYAKIGSSLASVIGVGATIIDMTIDPANDSLYLLTEAPNFETVLFSFPILDDGTLGEHSSEIIAKDIVSIKVKYIPDPVSPLEVTNTLSSGLGSLDSAIAYANVHAGPDTIRFNDNLFEDTIKTSTTFNLSDNSTVIMGDMNGDDEPDITIMLEGASANSPLFDIQGNYCHLASLNLQSGATKEDVSHHGISIAGEYNKVTSCFVGTDRTGMEASTTGNFLNGVTINGKYNQIGDASGVPNVFSGNENINVFIIGDSNRVYNSYIGTNYDASAIISSTNTYGVSISGDYNELGSDIFMSNIIAGNNIGINISSSADSNLIINNDIGINSSDNFSLPNTNDGVFISGTKNMLQYNRIAYNEGFGINISDFLPADSNRFSLDNSIYNNELGGITIAEGAQGGVRPPVIDGITPDGLISGSGAVGATIHFYTDSAEQAAFYLFFNTVVDEDGSWELKLEENISEFDYSSIEEYVTNTGLDSITVMQDSAGQQSAFSTPYLLEVPPCEDSLLVRSTEEFGCGSLYNAIVYANSHEGADTIRFAEGLDTIKLYNPLPAITGDSTVILGGVDENGFPKVTILIGLYDGGYEGEDFLPQEMATDNIAPAVTEYENEVLFGQGLLSIGYEGEPLFDDQVAISYKPKYCIIEGLNILNEQGSGGNGLYIVGDSNQISSCVIGIDAQNNSYGFETGVVIEGDYNIVGGETAIARNVISGNENGIKLYGSDNLVYHNYIGTSIDGMAAQLNSECGIYIDTYLGGGTRNLIGDTLSGIGNIILSGYEGAIWTEVADSNYIVSNFINITADSSRGFDNSQKGINIGDGIGNVIGGKEKWRNYIHSDSDAAIYLESFDYSDSPNRPGLEISYNTIGSLPDSSSLEGEIGIEIIKDDFQTLISYNTITNQDTAILYSLDADSITLHGNSIYGNDVAFAGDRNNVNDKPYELSYDRSTNTVTGSANDGDIIQFFADTAGQGQLFLGVDTVNISSDFSFKIDTSKIPHDLDYLTAMATNPNTKNTSDFSDAIYVDFDCNPLLVSTEEGYGCGSLHDAIIYANEHEGADTIRFAEGLDTLQLTPNALPVITDDSTMILGELGELGEDGIPKTTILFASMLEDQTIGGQVETTRGTAVATADDLVYSFESLFSIGYIDDFNEVLYPINHCEVKNLTLLGDNSGLGTAIKILGDSNQVSSCIIGIDANNEAKGFATGVFVEGDYNLIGGETDIERNVISGNNYGVVLGQASNNLIYNNYIGTSIDGMSAVSNSSDGVYIYEGQYNQIGDTLSGIGNVIMAKLHSETAIKIEGADYNFIVGNLINITADSLSSITDAIGVIINNSFGTIVGGKEEWRNYIHSDAERAVGFELSYEHESTTGNAIEISYNTIGQLPDGTDVPGQTGIWIKGANHQKLISNNIITNQDIAIDYTSADSITLFANSIYGNRQFFDGDPINFTVAPYDLKYNKSTHTVSGFANDGDEIQFFADTADQGQIYLGAVVLNGSDEFSFEVKPSLIPDGVDYLTAMATNPTTKNTSVFSEALLVDFDCDPLLVTLNTTDNVCGSLKYAIGYANEQAGFDTIRFAIDTVLLDEPLVLSEDSVVIDGDKNGDGAPNVVFVINTSNNSFAANPFLLTITSDHNTIKGINFINNPDDDVSLAAIRLLTADYNQISSCIIGTDTSMTDDLGFSTAISIDASSHNLIGDTSDIEQYNVIANSSGNGIDIHSMSSNNLINSTYFGLSSDGNRVLPNETSITINENSHGNIIGHAKNNTVIANSTSHGIQLFSDKNKVTNTYIGLDAFGNPAGNGRNGVLVDANDIVIEYSSIAHNDTGVYVASGDSIGLFKNRYSNNEGNAIVLGTSEQSSKIEPPIISSIDTTTGVITGTSTSNYVQLYADTIGPEGVFYVDHFIEVADDNSWSYTIEGLGDSITTRGVKTMLALSTDLTNQRTSEFSKPYCVNTSFSVNLVADTIIACASKEVTLEPTYTGAFTQVLWSEVSDRNNTAVSLSDPTFPIIQVSDFVGDTTTIALYVSDGLCNVTDTVRIIVDSADFQDDLLSLKPFNLGVDSFMIYPFDNDDIAEGITFKISPFGNVTEPVETEQEPTFADGVSQVATINVARPVISFSDKTSKGEYILYEDSIQYKPFEDFTGTDSLKYYFYSEGACLDSAYLIVTLEDSPIQASDDAISFELNESCAYTIDLATNDYIEEGLAATDVSISILETPQHGSISKGTEYGHFVYDGDGIQSEDSLTYVLSYEREGFIYRDTAEAKLSFAIPTEVIESQKVHLDSNAFIKSVLVVGLDSLLTSYDPSVPIQLEILQAPVGARAAYDEANQVMRIFPRRFFYDKDSLQYQVSYACTDNVTTGWITYEVGNVPPVAERLEASYESLGLVIDIGRLVSDQDRNIAFIDTLQGPKLDSLVEVKVKSLQRSIEIEYRSLSQSTYKDSLHYIVCDLGGECDSNWVVYELNIDEPVIYNAISPNDDDRNSYMRIDNLKFYTYNRVQVFNRENIPIFDREGYNNDDVVWNGKNVNGDALNAGSYLMILKYGSESNPQVVTTYVILKSSKDL